MEFNAGSSGQPLTISLEPGDAAKAPDNARPFSHRRRDRHGRGLRGTLVPSTLPGYRTRSEKFEDLVVDSADRLRSLWPGALEPVEYLVEEVPSQLEALIAAGTQAPLGKFSPAVPGRAGSPGEAAVIAIYRHPVEALCDTPGQVRELVHEVLIEQAAGLMNVDPETVDPSFRRFRGH